MPNTAIDPSRDGLDFILSKSSSRRHASPAAPDLQVSPCDLAIHVTLQRETRRDQREIGFAAANTEQAGWRRCPLQREPVRRSSVLMAGHAPRIQDRLDIGSKRLFASVVRCERHGAVQTSKNRDGSRQLS